MAAPTYKWEFIKDLWGNRTPKTATFEAKASEDFAIGTLVNIDSGQVQAAGASAASLLGISLTEDTGVSSGDPIKVAIIAPGMVIRGTADADASSLQGFNGKKADLNADGSLDVGDTAGGCLAVHRVNNSAGTEVDCVITESDMGPVN